MKLPNFPSLNPDPPAEMLASSVVVTLFSSPAPRCLQGEERDQVAGSLAGRLAAPPGSAPPSPPPVHCRCIWCKMNLAEAEHNIKIEQASYASILTRSYLFHDCMSLGTLVRAILLASLNTRPSAEVSGMVRSARRKLAGCTVGY